MIAAAWKVVRGGERKPMFCLRRVFCGRCEVALFVVQKRGPLAVRVSSPHREVHHRSSSSIISEIPLDFSTCSTKTDDGQTL